MELTIICPKCELLFSFKEERCQNEKCDYKIKTNKHPAPIPGIVKGK